MFDPISWSRTREATPLRFNEGIGVPTFSVDVHETLPRSIFGTKQPVGEEAPYLFLGRVTSLSSSGGTSTTIAGLQNKFNTMVDLPSYVGTVGDALMAWANLVEYQYSLFEMPEGDWPLVHGPMVEVNLWQFMNNVLAVRGLQLLGLAEDYINELDVTFGAERVLQNQISVDLLDHPSFSLAELNPAKYVEVVQYEAAPVLSVEIYPQINADAPVISVEAGETYEVDFEVPFWLTSVSQPICVPWVEADQNYYDGTTGVYAVAGNDNLPVTPLLWTDNGGSVAVSINPDGKSIHVTVVAASGPEVDALELSPFRIAMSSGEFYNSLRIVGSGQSVNEVHHKFPTGADPATTKQEIGEVVESYMVTTMDDVIAVGASLARNYNGFSYGASITTDTPVLPGDKMPLLDSSHLWRARSVTDTESNSTVQMEPARLLGDVGEFEGAPTILEWSVT